MASGGIGAPAATRIAATIDFVHSPRLSANDPSCSRSGGRPSGDVASRAARNSSSAAAIRSVSGTSSASPRSQAAAASAHEAVWRRRAAAAGSVTAQWSSTSERSTVRPSSSRAEPAAEASARSRRPAEAGRSPGGIREGRSASAASVAAGSAAANRSPPSGRPDHMSATASRQRASAPTASPSFVRYGVGVASGHSVTSAAASSSTPIVSPASRSHSEPGSNGGKHGRMYNSWVPAASPTSRGPPTPA